MQDSLELDIEIEDIVFTYNLFDKRDKFPFFIVRMLHLSSNTPTAIFYGSIFSELLRIAKCTLTIKNFILKVAESFSRMTVQSGNRAILTKQLKKVFYRYSNCFQKFGKIHQEIYTSIMKNT